MAFITLIPLVWLVAVTNDGGRAEDFSFRSKDWISRASKDLERKIPSLERAIVAAKATTNLQSIDAAEKALRTNRILRFNNLLDAGVTAAFLALVTSIVLLSVREWILLFWRGESSLSFAKASQFGCQIMRSQKPTPSHGRPARAGICAGQRAFGRGAFERAHQTADLCECERDVGSRGGLRAVAAHHTKQANSTSKRRNGDFKGVRRCC